MFLFLRSGVAKCYVLLGCDAVLWGNRIPTFRDNVLPCSSTVNKPWKTGVDLLIAEDEAVR